MTTACLKGFLDCSKLQDKSECTKKEIKEFQKKEVWVRGFMLLLSFALFSFLIGPNVQSTLPGREAVNFVSQSKRVNVKSEIILDKKIDKEKVSKAVLLVALTNVR